jgi:hypothetical protein
MRSIEHLNRVLFRLLGTKTGFNVVCALRKQKPIDTWILIGKMGSLIDDDTSTKLLSYDDYLAVRI